MHSVCAVGFLVQWSLRDPRTLRPFEISVMDRVFKEDVDCWQEASSEMPSVHINAAMKAGFIASDRVCTRPDYVV